MTYGWELTDSESLHDKLKADLKTAMRAKDIGVRDAIRMVISEFPKITVPIVLESGKKSFRCKEASELSNDDILGLIRGLVKSEKTLLEAKGESTSEYLEALGRYIPAPAEDAEIRAWISGNVDLSSFKSPMQAMGVVMKHFGQRADGNRVKALLKEFSA